MWSATREAVRFTLVLPVQSAARAKSRLVAPDGVDHERLARAIATDALTAVRACDRVTRLIVVTSDAVIAPAAIAAGDDVVPDAGAGLGAAVAAGVARALEVAPGAAIGVLLADVPALTAHDLATALDVVTAHPSAFVPDLEGSGTVLLTALGGTLLRPSFGDGSAQRHEALGAARLDLDLPRLRRDVDTSAGLRAAAALGLGVETAQVLRSALTCVSSAR